MTKETIVTAALRLFLTRGYQSVSLADVAKEAGITKGAIYHYFSGKEDLLQRSLQLLSERVTAMYQGLLSDKYSVRQVLEALIVERTPERYCRDLLQMQESCRLDYAQFALEIMRKYPGIQQQIEQSNATVCEFLTHRLQQAAVSGEIKPETDCFALAAGILALVNGQNALGSHFQSLAVRQRVLETVSGLLELA
ncbi:MAG: helix-turn-helix domain-containing protein [Sporomusaceae bacterium]|nr:helix-turn-helix domain-containing protein [Sporomusaceae bacterium]